jgi:hypothetical protein
MTVRFRWALTGLCGLLASAATATAQDAPAPRWAWTSGGLAVEGAIETYSAYYGMSGTWWNLSAEAAPGFDLDRSFAEFWIHPKLDGRFSLGDDAEIYGALSVAATQTIGSDAFDYDDEGAVRFGSAALGVRGTPGDWNYDLSVGRQLFTLGTGMLLTAGSSNGYSWGGGASAQRKVWGNSLVARAGRRELTATAFERGTVNQARPALPIFALSHCSATPCTRVSVRASGASSGSSAKAVAVTSPRPARASTLLPQTLRCAEAPPPQE